MKFAKTVEEVPTPVRVTSFTCPECGHIEKSVSNVEPTYAETAIGHHYVREHVPVQKVKLNKRDADLYVIPDEATFELVKKYAKRGSQYSSEAYGRWNGAGKYLVIQTTETYEEGNGGTCLRYDLYLASDYVDKLNIDAANLIGQARTLRSLLK